MIHLEAVYTQQLNRRWSAHIVEAPYIFVESAEDLESAKVILRIITSEEISYRAERKRRQDWEITKETIIYRCGEGISYGS